MLAFLSWVGSFLSGPIIAALAKGWADHESAINTGAQIEATKEEQAARKALAEEEMANAKAMSTYRQQQVEWGKLMYVSPQAQYQAEMAAAAAKEDEARTAFNAPAPGSSEEVFRQAQETYNADMLQAAQMRDTARKNLAANQTAQGEGVAGVNAAFNVTPWQGQSSEAQRVAAQARADLPGKLATLQDTMTRAYAANDANAYNTALAAAQKLRTDLATLDLNAGKSGYAQQIEWYTQQLEAAKLNGAPKAYQKQLTQQIANLDNAYGQYLESMGFGAEARGKYLDALRMQREGRDRIAAQIIGGSLTEGTRAELARLGGGALKAVGTMVRMEGKNRIVIEFSNADAAAGHISGKAQVDLMKLLSGIGNGTPAVSGGF